MDAVKGSPLPRRLGRRALKPMGHPCEPDAERCYHPEFTGTVWTYAHRMPDPTDRNSIMYSWVSPENGTLGRFYSGEKGYMEAMRWAKRYHPKALIKFREDLNETNVLDVFPPKKPTKLPDKFRKPLPKGQKHGESNRLSRPAPARKTAVPAMPILGKGDEIEALLETLESETDPERKKRLRRELRKRGHRGGLQGGPGAPRSAVKKT